MCDETSRRLVRHRSDDRLRCGRGDDPTRYGSPGPCPDPTCSSDTTGGAHLILALTLTGRVLPFACTHTHV